MIPAIAALLPTALTAVERLLDKVIPDPEAKAKALLELKKEENAQALQELTLALQSDQMQADINKIEAGSSSLFVAGARPFIMWTCGVAFAYAAILEPLLRFIATVGFGYSGNYPQIDTNLTMQVLLGLLGLGGLRSFEKVKGVTK